LTPAGSHVYCTMWGMSQRPQQGRTQKHKKRDKKAKLPFFEKAYILNHYFSTDTMKNELKLYTLLCLLLLLGSCAKDHYVEAFEDALGPDNSKELTHLVLLFETDFLQKKYLQQPIHKAYEQLLMDYLDGDPNVFQDSPKPISESFLSGKLYHEVCILPDSVWIERDSSKLNNQAQWAIFRAFKSLDWEDIVPDYSFSPEIIEQYTVEQLLELEQNRPIYNSMGAYIRALEKVQERDVFLQHFFELKETAGFMDISIVFQTMKRHQVDYNDPLIRWIIVMELLH